MEPRLAALCRYALRLTGSPSAVERADLEPLYEHGLDDRAIVDLNQVVAYFNYVNRIAEGLGVELEERWPDATRVHRPYRLGDSASTIPDVPADSLPWLSVPQMREVDRLIVEEVGIDLPRMMENAGRNLAGLVRSLIGGGVSGRQIVVLAGPGGNGGGGLVAARHLANAGAAVRIVLATPVNRLSSVTARQLQITSAQGISTCDAPDDTEEVDLVIDALLGYSQAGPPREGATELIRWSRGRRVVALDVPSGLELETGALHEPHVAAEATMTLALPKQGLRAAPNAVGGLYLADISVPALVYRQLGLSFATPFGEGPLVRLRNE